MTNTSDAERLYTPDILALAVELANFPITPDQRYLATLRSRSCGSTLEIGLELDSDGALATIGLRVSACAIGQASAAIFARAAGGQTISDLHSALRSVEAWLAGSSNMPHWPDLALLGKAKAYPGRHEAILLPWRAAISALSKN